MQTSKKAPPQRKADSKDEITTSKINNTLWEPSSLGKIERRANGEENKYEIEQNQIHTSFNAGRGFSLFNREPVVYLNKLGASIISQFKNLQKLHLVFNSCDVDGNDLQEMGLQIGRNLSNLKCLKLDFNSLFRLDAKHLQIFIQEICKNLTNLKELRFYVGDNPQGMTGKALRGLTHDICRYLRKLESFNFRCPSNGVKDDDIEKFLCDIGSSFPKLETLKLDFRWVMEFENKSINALNYLFDQHSKHLKTLSLDLSVFPRVRYWNNTGLKEEDYEKIVKNITTKLRNLQKLKLELSGCVTDKGAKNIMELILKSLSKLTHLELCISNKISDQGLKGISTVMKRKKNILQQIKLGINSNEGFDNLMDGVANLTSLQELELSFRDCKKIGSNALRGLSSKVIKSSLKLKKLKLNFSNCRGIKGKGLEEFLTEIVNRQQSWESENSIGDFGKSEDKINELLASCPLIKWKINNY